MRKATNFFLAMLTVSAFTTPSRADNPPFGIRKVFSANLDQIPITLVFVVEDDIDKNAQKVISAHYFYDRVMTDIPLSISDSSNQLVFRGTDGSRFVLRPMIYVSHPWDPAVAPAPSVDKADFLQGTWSLGARTVPIKFQFSFAGGDQVPDARSERYARAFIRGILTNNPDEAAGAVTYPLAVNGRCGTIIRNKTAFRANWSDIATPELMEGLRTAVPHDMFGKDGLTMVGSGMVWFGDRGAAILNVDCPRKRRTATVARNRRR